jgi:SNF2 family DNA or RNA helicase
MSPHTNMIDIQMLSSTRATYQKGVTYFKNGRVTKVEYDPNYSAYRAIVRGTNSYKVVIYLDKQDDSINDIECSCPAFSNYSGYCKHMVAVLLYVQKYGEIDLKSSLKEKPTIEKREITSTNSRPVLDMEVQKMIQLFEDNLLIEPTPIVEQLLQVQYVLGLVMSPPNTNIDKSLTVQLKVGGERLYVVKSIRDFLRAFKRKQPITFTKNFVYDPILYQPTKQDETMIRFLLDLFDSELAVKQIITPWSSDPVNARTIIIPPHKIGDFLKLLSEVNYVLEYDEKQYTSLPIMENECPISFSLNEQEGYFVLQSECGNPNSIANTKLSEPFLLSEDGYCFATGNIYKLNQVQWELLFKLHRQIERSVEGKLFISPKQMESFISVVLPLLKKQAKLTVERQISDKIVEPPIHVSILLDRKQEEKEERITAQITYIYGEININPLKSDVSIDRGDKILFRDTDKEQQIMNIFEDVGFKYNGQELYLDNEADLYHFLSEKVPQLETMADIYTTDSMQSIVVKPQKAVPKIDIDASTHWLEFHFELPDIDEKELQNILQAFIEKKRYYRLSDGVFISLENEMSDSLHSFFNEERNNKFIIENQKLKLPAYRAMQLEEMIAGTGGLRVTKGQRFRQLIRNIKEPDNLDFSPPIAMAPILRDYQLLGFQWLKMLAHYRFGGILADDMGLGKTLQALAFIVSEIEQTSANTEPLEDLVETSVLKSVPALVIVPASLIYNWEKECTHFAPQLRTMVVTGTKEERQVLLADITDTDVLITSYPLLRRDIDLYKPYFFQTLILDEAQSVKNQRTQTARSVKRIRSGTCFALSGTPIENKLDELWSICDIVLPGLFPNQQSFRQLSTEQIAQRVRPFILRRMKRDVLTELPDKIESVQFLELTTEQKKVYLATLKKIQNDTKQLLQEDGFQRSRMKILAGITRMRQICCHPSLYLENYTADSGKFTHFFDLLEELLPNGHRVLVFSQFTSMLALIKERLQEHEISYHYLDGKTPARERLEMVDRFNDGENDLFLISLRAGGTGLNLTGADTVILYDLWWNPAVEQQAIDRAHRMGQKKTVQVIKLISRGTIEEKIYELHQKKQALFEQVIQPGEQMLSALSENDIMNILDL